MRANPFDIDFPRLKADAHNKPVMVALDVEDNAVIGEEIGGTKRRLDVVRRVPLRRLNRSDPLIQCGRRIGMHGGEVFQQFLTKNFHAAALFAPLS